MRRPALLLLALALGSAAPCEAQETADNAHVIRWYEPAAVIGGVALLSALDETIADHYRDHRSQFSQDVADVVRHVGQPEVYGTVTVGLVAAGLIAHDPAVTRAGGRLALALAIAGVTGGGLKFTLGRDRPIATTDAYRFHLFSFSDASFPSGHAMLAFALATSLADDVPSPWAKAGFFGAAAAVAWSRLYDQEHWLSDVAGAAALGFTSAKLADGRWRIFHLRPPGFLLGPEGPAVGWHLTFRE
jgi:membrane-associated phospholipid phosphatase